MAHHRNLENSFTAQVAAAAKAIGSTKPYNVSGFNAFLNEPIAPKTERSKPIRHHKT
jgi:hypothetical protein